MIRMLPVADSALGIVGFALASYGVLRESFALLSKGRPFGEGRFGEGTFEGRGKYAVRLVAMGRAVRLLPADGELTLTDRRKNAVLLIVGVAVGAAALVGGVLLRLYSGR